VCCDFQISRFRIQFGVHLLDCWVVVVNLVLATYVDDNEAFYLIIFMCLKIGLIFGELE
jgi:hypothetical protein